MEHKKTDVNQTDVEDEGCRYGGAGQLVGSSRYE